MNNLFKKVTTLLKPFFCIFMALLMVNSVSAWTEAELDYLNTIGAYYYDDSGTSCVTGVSGVNINGSDAATKVWTGLVSLGFTDLQAAAIMGNIQAESNFNPFAVNGANNYNQMSWSQLLNDIDPATGLIQTKGGRRRTMLENLPNNLQQYFLNPSHLGKSSYQTIISEIGESDYDAVVASQLKTFKSEMDSYDRYKKFLTEPTVEDAAVTFCTWNETPGSTIAEAEANCKASPRASYAREYYTKFSGTTSTATTAAANDGSNVIIIGDSITVRSEQAIKKLMPNAYIRAEVGRHFNQGLDVLKSIPQSSLRDILVFALGTNANGTTEANARAVIDYVGSSRQVIFVTNYALEDHDAYIQHNALFTSLANEYSNVIVADWATSASADPTKYIAKESQTLNVHPTVPDGTDLFAKTLYGTITNGAINNSNANSCYSSGGAWNSTDLPVYDQCDPRWGNLYFGPDGIYGHTGFTICWGGCGPTSFAILATVLLGREILPTETNNLAGLGGQLALGQGSYHTITNYLAQQYGLQYKAFSSGGTREGCIAAVNSALQDGWMLHVAGGNMYGTGNAPFTPDGHYIGIAGLTPDGKWLIADSVSAKSGHGNKAYDPADVLNAGLNCSTLKGIKR